MNRNRVLWDHVIPRLTALRSRKVTPETAKKPSSSVPPCTSGRDSGAAQAGTRRRPQDVALAVHELEPKVDRSRQCDAVVAGDPIPVGAGVADTGHTAEAAPPPTKLDGSRIIVLDHALEPIEHIRQP